MFMVVSACKKEDDSTPGTGTGGGGSSYSLRAPSCLITSASTLFGDVYCSYDSQKRIIRQSQNNDSSVTTYTYSGNIILETSTEIQAVGSIETYTSRHHLNPSGFIDSTYVEAYSYITLYEYNTQGYLVRRLNKSLSGIVSSGTSYQYFNGNKTSEYQLIYNWQTGALEDSTLSVSYTYYPNLNGKLEEWEAWTTRLGRASVNAVKTIGYGSDTDSYSYSLDAKGNPIQLEINGQTTALIGWECR
jgi:hypothetical protein